MVNLYRMRQLLRQTVKVQWRIEREQARATKVTTVLTGMPRGGGRQDQTADGAIRLTELKEAYKEVLEELEQMKAELGPMIDTIENADQRAAMRMRYIFGNSPEVIADAICVADRTVFRYLAVAEADLCKRFPDQVNRSSIPLSCQ